MTTAETQELLELRLDELLDAVAADASTAASGSIAAFLVAGAAALVAMSARRASEWGAAAGVVAQAALLRERAAGLVQADARALSDARALLRDPDAAGGDGELGDALERAAIVPLRIAHVAADVAELAREAADYPGDARADAAAAAVLAHGAARAAAHLVAINLAARADDARAETARSLAEAAGRSAAAALEGAS